nr:hypothetical protein [Staphylococcus saccharolyticus]
MFTAYKSISELENAYDVKRQQVNDELEQLYELKYQMRRKCEQTYNHFLYL